VKKRSAEPKTLAEIDPSGVGRDERAYHTYPGQASWGIAGSVMSCRECVAWGFTNVPVEYFAGTGALKPRKPKGETIHVIPLNDEQKDEPKDGAAK
jgi:hypothetical protein